MKKSIRIFMPVALLFTLLVSSCKKEIAEPVDNNSGTILTEKAGNGHLQQTKTFSSDVVISWLNMQLNMLRTPLPPGTGSQNAERAQGYSGVTLYEAVVEGMPAYQSMAGQLTAFPVMPATEPGKAYHWGASANAALAEINRRLFPTTAPANVTAMNNLENSWKNMYATQVDAVTLLRSITYGREVATRIANWAATDGFANVNPPYVAPTGFGFWVPTSPTPAVSPYMYQRRLMVPGVANGTAIEPPPPYSIVPGSPYWNMVLDVYNKSLPGTLTPEQIAAAVYYRDAPGYPGGGGFISILYQILAAEDLPLDEAALLYAKVGIAQHEATVILFTNKYIYNTMRPVTYIRTVMGHTTWNTVIPTPNHPEFPSGHATINGATLAMFAHILGNNYPMTLHTYDYLGLPPRPYSSFTEMSHDMANSRVWGGLHYQATCDKSLIQGSKITENIIATIDFHH